ncbi:hypothetical protein ElyMa_006231700 [Elysia marginata]|uniref:PiggyBac transposable element-derived protein domain-containing protein n=1 Tax=Elysia marginata TaxID=1093978 RepID=A0AAV4H8A0_9GAST|nr:hypothetical protein ElyMa_006231700 [Elysia marginata]
MNSSDEEDILILLSLRRRRKRKRQSIWCREHFLLRESREESQHTFLHLLDNPDEELFFNYTRMSYSTYNALKSLVLELLKLDHSNWRKSISAEEKLIITLRCLATGASFSSMTVPFHMSRRSITRHNYLSDVPSPVGCSATTGVKTTNQRSMVQDS